MNPVITTQAKWTETLFEYMITGRVGIFLIRFDLY
jgi:hypothetical protein